MDISEKLIRLLFDFQRFEQNERLDKIIHSTELSGGFITVSHLGKLR